MTSDELRLKRRLLDEKTELLLQQADEIAMESARVAEIAGNSAGIIDNIDNEFEKITSLDKTDIAFVMFASMLQSLRWILMPELKIPRIDELSPEIEKEDRLRPNEKNHQGGIYDQRSSGAEYELSELSKYKEKKLDKALESQNEFYKNIAR